MMDLLCARKWRPVGAGWRDQSGVTHALGEGRDDFDAEIFSQDVAIISRKSH